MQDTQSSLTLKLKHNDDIRRIRVEKPEEKSFEEFRLLIGSLFVDVPSDSYVIKYEDEDGDKLSITSTLEWQEAVRFFNTNPQRVHHLVLASRVGSKRAAEASESESEGEEDEEDWIEVKLEDIAPLIEDAFKTFGLVSPPPHCFRPPQQPEVPRHPACHPSPRVGGIPHHFRPHPWCAPRGGPSCGLRQGCPPRPHIPVCRPAYTLDENTKCTFTTTGQSYASHKQWFNCMTCGLVGSEGCCLACANTCHRGHALLPRGPSPAFYCDCGAGARGVTCRSKGVNRKEINLPTTEEELMKLSISDLKAALDARGISYADCVDKFHLVEKIRNSDTNTDAAPSTPASPTPSPAPLPVEESSTNLQQPQPEVVKEEVAKQEPVDKKQEERVEEETKPADTINNNDNNTESSHPFARKLELLRLMGFEDNSCNIAALVASRGDLEGAVTALLSDN